MTNNTQVRPSGTVEEGIPPAEFRKGKNLNVMAKGGSLSLIGRFSLLFFGLVLQVILARNLGPAKVGIINLGLAIIMIASIVALFGMDQAVVRFIPGHLEANNKAHVIGTIRSSLLMVIAVSIAVAFIVFISANFFANRVFNKPEVEPVLRILAFGLPFTAVMLLGVAIAQAYKRVSLRVGIVQTAVPIFKIIGAIIAIFIFGAQVTSVAYAFLAAAIGGCVLAMIGVWRLVPKSSTTSHVNTASLARPIFVFSAPLAFAALFARANGQLETFLLASLSTAEQVGIYSISFKLGAFVAISLTALNFIYAPFASGFFTKGDKTQLSSLYKTVTRWAVILSLAIFMVIFTFSSEVMAIFGRDFAQGVPVIRMIAVSQLVFVATGPSAITLTMTGHPRLNFLNILLTLAITFALGVYLIPRYGAMGAAVGGVVTITLMNLLRIIEVYVILHIHPYQRNIIKPLIACGVAILSIGFINSQIQLPSIWRLIVLGSLMLVVYFLILFALGLDDNDRRILKIIRRRLTRLKSQSTTGQVNESDLPASAK